MKIDARPPENMTLFEINLLWICVVLFACIVGYHKVTLLDKEIQRLSFGYGAMVNRNYLLTGPLVAQCRVLQFDQKEATK